MIELPESQTLARQLEKEFAGKRITAVEAGHSPHGFAFYFGDPAGYGELLDGRVIDGVHAIGGQVEMVIGQMRLVFGDGVNIRLFRDGRLASGRPLPPKHQLRLECEDGSGIVCSVQMYGSMQAFPEGMNDNAYYQVAGDKPSPLTSAFDEPYFQSILAAAKPGLSAKGLLATDQRIPGLGNGCLQDILFQARVNPKTKVRDLDDKDLARLFASLKSTLAAMVAGGGRDTEKDLYGETGGYSTVLSAKTAGRPCPVCGGPITRQAYMGGNVYFCPVCQPV